MTSYQPESRHRARALALATILALAGAALTLWLGVTGGQAFVEFVDRDGVQFSPISGLLLVVASLLLLLAHRQEAKDQSAPPVLKFFAVAVALTGVAPLILPFFVG